ncbi:DUF6279 family lipoprotein [Azomonas macrocytogenes]|uniref:Lipoprotein n=1 Tax=Azomonas macrocytogenes TaxID=69962 RepID=A0A839SZU2_AZOMA|nr:DUF6279 family lipoprotein [Azomonas macrocytogenes]MBB3102229.1 hypothetical protein [Azomonas macrocytogenes]
MRNRKAFTGKAGVYLLLTMLLLASCSRITLIYRNLDTLIYWSALDYVDMTDSQKREFKARLQKHLAWHCTTQLPLYLDSLKKLQTEPVTHASLQRRYDEAKAAATSIAEEITPSMVTLLQSLSDKQVEELGKALHDKQQERIEEFVEPPLNKQIAKRAERMEDRLEDWLGDLNKAQRQRILQWSRTLGDQNSRWVASRAQWDKTLLATLSKRRSPEFPQQIARLLQTPDSSWSPAYRVIHERNEQAGIDLAFDLHTLSDAGQHQHLAARLDSIRQDLANLKCLQETR